MIPATRFTRFHLLTLPFVAWPLGCIALGQGRWEHVAMLVGVPLLAFASPRSRRLFLGLLPMGLLGLVYDAMRWVKHVGVSAGRVHVCDLRALDMRLASVTMNGERGSVHDWVQANPSSVLDAIFAVPYGTFIFIAVAFAVFLYVRDYERMRLFGWAFLLVNLAGFVTYHLYPAAAPWYFHTHGCAVDLLAPANEGANLARVDARFGMHYFRDFYARSSDTFGAVPSLHVSYPMLILLFGWPVMGWPGRVFAVTFLVSMCSAAVYLDHHWIVDVLLGLAYAITGYAAVMGMARAMGTARAVGTPRTRTRAQGVEAPPLGSEAAR